VVGTHLRLRPLGNPRPHKNSNIVLPVIGHDVVGRREELDVGDVEARFFFYFAERALFEGFVEFQVPAGECPCSCAVSC
jgi:hypothetical protein